MMAALVVNALNWTTEQKKSQSKLFVCGAPDFASAEASSAGLCLASPFSMQCNLCLSTCLRDPRLGMDFLLRNSHHLNRVL